VLIGVQLLSFSFFSSSLPEGVETSMKGKRPKTTRGTTQCSSSHWQKRQAGTQPTHKSKKKPKSAQKLTTLLLLQNTLPFPQIYSTTSTPPPPPPPPPFFLRTTYVCTLWKSYKYNYPAVINPPVLYSPPLSPPVPTIGNSRNPEIPTPHQNVLPSG
jgi:hypothetical protein